MPAGVMCYFDIYADKGCQGNYMGLVSGPENQQVCQEVLLGTTGNMPTVGAKSAKLVCKTTPT